MDSIDTKINNAIEADKRKSQYGVTRTSVHTHNGIDSPYIPFTNITNKQFTVSAVIPGTQAATASNYGPFWIANAECFIRSMYESHTVAGTAGGTVVVFVEILRPGEASGAGTAVNSFNLKANPNVPVRSQLVVGGTPAILNEFDRLSLFPSGTLTTVGGVVVTVLLEYLS